LAETLTTIASTPTAFSSGRHAAAGHHAGHRSHEHLRSGLVQKQKPVVELDVVLEHVYGWWQERQAQRISYLERTFARFDVDGDGVLSLDEFSTLLQHLKDETGADAKQSVRTRGLSGLLGDPHPPLSLSGSLSSISVVRSESRLPAGFLC
jgi:hypothetical protein